jgi:Tol biopolymer transport system component
MISTRWKGKKGQYEIVTRIDDGVTGGQFAVFIVESSTSAPMWARRATHGRMEGKLMPDFDTRKPQEDREPRRSRIQSIANGLQSGFTATKRRLPFIVDTLSILWVENRPRSLLVGAVLLFLIAAAPLGLLIYSLSGLADRQLVYQFDGYIWTINPDGSDPTKLPATTWYGPNVSPNGEQIAFVKDCPTDSSSSASASAASPEPDTHYCIDVVNTDGSDPRTLVDGRDMDIPNSPTPVWSPDSQQIAFPRGFYDDCSLFVVDSDGQGAPEPLIRHPFRCSGLTWSPDGKITTRVGSQIYAMDVSTGEHDRLLKLPEVPGANRNMSLSPDGTEIAFTHAVLRKKCYGADTSFSDELCYRKEGQSDIYTMNADGSEVTRLTHSPDLDFAPTWSPNGKQIAFLRQYSAGKSGIYTMNSDGSNLTLVKEYVATNTVQSLDW